MKASTYVRNPASTYHHDHVYRFFLHRQSANKVTTCRFTQLFKQPLKKRFLFSAPCCVSKALFKKKKDSIIVSYDTGFIRLYRLQKCQQPGLAILSVLTKTKNHLIGLISTLVPRILSRNMLYELFENGDYNQNQDSLLMEMMPEMMP